MTSRELLLRAADQGATYLTWRWLDTPDTVDYAVLDTAALTEVLDALNRALPHPLDDEDDTQAARRALADGPFADPDREHALATALAGAVLPTELAHTLLAAADTLRIRLRVIPSPRLARIPWELLVLPDGRRLLDIADISLDPPATLYADRGCQPTPWQQTADQPVLYLLCPATTSNAGTRTSGRIGAAHPDSILDVDGVDELESWLSQQQTGGRIQNEDRDYALCGAPNRDWLGRRLRDQPTSRLLYYGHASSADQEIGSAAIHLADDHHTYGLAHPIGAHRPFTALDALLGTLTTDPTQNREGQPGHEIWPMPPRVAIIACDSGADHRQLEPFGLVIAYLNAGAELVTATRWTLPTDHAIHTIHPTAAGQRPTTDLMRQVDHCHDLDHPIPHLADWQRSKLAAWTHHGHIQDTPLIWAALTTHLAPDRPVGTPP